ncbi:hypothetical protein [Jiangella anatolica]|uniref:DUF600 domain-containing protein n=1 Tax=Jiangella anatolica TaxID=2670374 RepID=A0A2W2BLD1_9ACTN|nr:hypothetical protein [Jiangella anatolica]PZF81088.1 hypothetical protein C1I92_22555 [Jiangella anatolica]
MSIPDQATLDAVGWAMIDAAGDDWRRLTLDVTAAGAEIEAGLAIERTGGDVDTGTELGLDLLDAVEDLRTSMARPGLGAWYLATITVTADRRVQGSFDFENPPWGGIHDGTPESGDADPEDLLEDHRMFPRDDAHLPAWHPARANGSHTIESDERDRRRS